MLLTESDNCIGITILAHIIISDLKVSHHFCVSESNTTIAASPVLQKHLFPILLNLIRTKPNSDQISIPYNLCLCMSYLFLKIFRRATLM